jgi:carbon-monoxide dehydrogenase large subunit
LSILGTRVQRVEDPGFLTRGAVYTEDVQDERLDGACHVFFVRSPIAHARINSIDLSAAREVPGVIAAYSAADILDGVPEVKPMMSIISGEMTQPLLARDVVRYAGEPVAVIVTEQPYQGEDAAELADVDYDPLPVTVDMSAALDDTAARLFPAAGTNVAATFGDRDTFDPALFDGCEAVVTRTIENQRVAPAPMESRAAAAAWGDDGRLTAWIPNQGAQGTRASLAAMLGLDPARVRIVTPAVGGGFGAKFGADPEHGLVCLVAQKLGRPARWAETRNENLAGMTHGRAQRQTVTIGGSRDGTVQAYRLEIIQDCGAYPKIGTILPSLTILMTPGPYGFPRAESAAVAVVTNTVPIGAYRGAGRPEATAAVERKNLLPKFTEPHKTAFGAVYDTGDYEAALDRVLAAADYAGLREEQAKRRAAGETRQLGVGVSCYVEITGGGSEAGAPKENGTVEVHPDGTATILTGTSPHGQGHETVWAMLASDELGIPIDKITVKWGDTDLIPEGGGTGGSRSLQQGGAAVRQASIELIEVARGR